MFYDNEHVQKSYTALLAIGCARGRLHVASDLGRLNHGPSVHPVTGPPQAHRQLLCLLTAALPVLASTLAVPLVAQPAPALASIPAATPALGMERKVKAAFLYKFLGYTEFPASAFAEPGSPLVIGVLGADELVPELARVVSARTVHGRAIAVKAIREHDPLAGVHLLFVGGSEDGRVRSALKAAQPVPMLTVTEAENGLRQGSVINFKIIHERVRFDISLAAADKHGVRLSSRLLTVANQVYKGTP